MNLMQYLIPRGFMVDITTPLEGDGGNQHTHNPGAPPGDDVGYAALYKQARIGISPTTWISCVFLSSTNKEWYLYRVNPAINHPPWI